MRTLLSLLLMTLGFVAQAATPTLTNFFPYHFIVTPNAAAATNVIKLRLNPVQFDTNAGTITIRGSFTNQGGLYIFNTTNIFEGDTIINTNTVIYNILTTNYFDLSHIYYSNVTIVNTNVTINNYGTTNYYTNTVVTYEGVTNNFTNVVQNFNGVTNNYTNTVFYISNSVFVINGVTNDMAQYWTNDAGTYRPIQTEIALEVTNTINYGYFRTPSFAGALLSPGSNTLDIANAAMIFLVGPSTPGATLELSDSAGVGKHVWIFNSVTNSTFAIASGPTYDNPAHFIHLRGDLWEPANVGDSLELASTLAGWDEINRSYPTGPPPATMGDMVWTNDTGRVRLVSTNTVQILELQGNDGLGAGNIEFWNGGTRRWTMATGVLYPEANYDIGTSINPVQTLWLGGITGLKLDTLRISENAGSPENSVIAPVGSLYLQNDGGPGTTLWTKTNGAGNTGWSTVGGGTINPTDGYLPYRSNATTFENSPWFRVETNKVGFNSTSTFLAAYAAANSLALGYSAMPTNAGSANIAIGNSALANHGSGSGNIAIGSSALTGSTNGGSNIAIGWVSQQGVGGGSQNVSVGNNTLRDTTSGENNVAVGHSVMVYNREGSRNTAVGWTAGKSASTSTNLLDDTFVGYNTGPQGAATPTNAVAIGSGAAVTNSNEVVIGNTNNTRVIFPITSYTGTGSLALSDDGTYKSFGGIGLTINPTDGYLPYRSNSTTFGNSPVVRQSATNIYVQEIEIGVDASWFGAPRPALSGKLSLTSAQPIGMWFSPYVASSASSPAGLYAIMSQADGGARSSDSYGIYWETDLNSDGDAATGDPAHGSIGAWFDANNQGANQVGLVGNSRGNSTNNYAVIARSRRSTSSSTTNVALYAEIESPGIYTPMQAAIVGDVSSVDTAALKVQTSVLLLDNRGTAYPLITARTNNGTTVFYVNDTGSIWTANDCSALTFTDRSRSPDSVADAYKIVRSHHAKSGRVDHAKLDPLAYGRRGATNDPETRDIGMVLSAQAMVIQDLEDRLTKTENALKQLQK